MTDRSENDLLASLLDQEKRVWDALVSGDQAADAAALSDDFLGVYPDGFAEKADHTGQLDHGPTIRSFTLSDYRVRPLGADHAVRSYRAEFRRLSRSEDEVMYVSSIWQRQGVGWVNIFSQDTPAVDA